VKPAAASYEIPRGTTLGKYEIVRKIATGGMAEIYLACVRGQAGFEKVVVLKRILPHFAEDPRFVQMFLDEARLAATLRHPNIADVYDVVEVDGTLFFTMEYIHGQDVRSIRAATRKRNEMVPLAIALAIVQGTAAALQCAHQKQGADGRSLGLVHRDVSASNVIVSYDGAVKLLDFGIARANDHQHKTQTGTLKGKAPYMSPEQCRGQRLDRRSDLFSLGVMMFELTVGRRPFRGDNDFTIMEQIVHGVAPAPSSITAGYPAELEAIVMKLLAREPDARYATAEDMLHDLELFLAQHELWVSSNSVGKYMRVVFADRVDAWENASHDGVSLGEYVADTPTSQSYQSELVTPPSVFPKLPAAGTPSVQLAVPPPISQALPAEPEPSSPSAIASVVGSSKIAVVYPELRPSRGRRVAVSVLGGLLVGGGGIAGFYLWPKPNEPAEVRGVLEPVTPSATEKPAVPEPSTEKPAVPEPSTEKPAVPEPSTEKPAVPEPSTESPPAQPPPAEPRVEVRPETAEPTPAPLPRTTVIAPLVTPAQTPVAKTPPKHVVSPKLPIKPPPKKPDGAPGKPDKPDKEKEWDPNSPFLPPS
jgi:serine/threonine protein kinase